MGLDDSKQLHELQEIKKKITQKEGQKQGKNWQKVKQRGFGSINLSVWENIGFYKMKKMQQKDKNSLSKFFHDLNTWIEDFFMQQQQPN